MEVHATADKRSEVQSEAVHECGGVSGRLRGCQEVTRSVRVSRSEWVSRSSRVIWAADGSCWVSRQASRCIGWMWRGERNVDWMWRSRQE